jgi:hypothetical protein
MKRNPKVASNEKINKVVWEWFKNARSKHIHISSLMVQSETLAVAKSLGNDQCNASTGWLDSKGTILCGTEPEGNLKMWMKV